PHNRDDLITRVVRAPYDPGAGCPTWMKFLCDVLPDREVRDFLQRWVGYCLTGETSEHCLALLWGGGRNGKSTLVETLTWLLDDYAAAAKADAFMAKKHEGVRNDLAALVGKRLVTVSETGDGRRLDENLVKEATGGDTITARFLFAEFF